MSNMCCDWCLECFSCCWDFRIVRAAGQLENTGPLKIPTLKHQTWPKSHEITKCCQCFEFWDLTPNVHRQLGYQNVRKKFSMSHTLYIPLDIFDHSFGDRNPPWRAFPLSMMAAPLHKLHSIQRIGFRRDDVLFVNTYQGNSSRRPSLLVRTLMSLIKL